MSCIYCGDDEVDPGEICFTCMDTIETRAFAAEMRGDDAEAEELYKLLNE
jgi:hypothetical protein